MHILKRLKIQLKSAVETEAGGPSENTFYKVWNENQRKQYINEHPQSKFAQKESGGNKPSVRKPTKNSSDEEKLLNKVRKDPEYIQCIENPSENVQLESVKQDGKNIVYIENPSEKVQLEAVKQNGYAIQYIENPSEKVKLEAVKENGLAIYYIENPSEKVQLEAVKNYRKAFGYIKDPSSKLVQSFSKSFKKIKSMGIDTDSKEYKASLKSASWDPDTIENEMEHSLRYKDVNTTTKNGILQIDWISQSNGDAIDLYRAIEKNLKKKSKNKMPVPVRIRWCTRYNPGDWDTYEFILGPHQ